MAVITDPDVVVENHGTLFTFILCSEVAEDWVDENVEIPGPMWTNRRTFACEHRFAHDIAVGMQDAGLKVC